MKQLATGNRFADLQAGAGEFAIAEHLRGQVRSMGAARDNAENANSFVEIAEGGLNEQSNILIRLRELAIQGASETYGDREREMLDLEFQQLVSELDRIAKSTSFGENRLLDGSNNSYTFQVGAYNTENDKIAYNATTDTTASELDLAGLDVRSADDAGDSLQTIDEAMHSIAVARANFGSVQSRLNSTIDNASVQIENLEAARSRMADTDVAQAVSEVVRGQAMQSYQMQVLNYANQQPGTVLRLIV